MAAVWGYEQCFRAERLNKYGCREVCLGGTEPWPIGGDRGGRVWLLRIFEELAARRRFRIGQGSTSPQEKNSRYQIIGFLMLLWAATLWSESVVQWATVDTGFRESRFILNPYQLGSSSDLALWWEAGQCGQWEAIPLSRESQKPELA